MFCITAHVCLKNLLLHTNSFGLGFHVPFSWHTDTICSLGRYPALQVNITCSSGIFNEEFVMINPARGSCISLQLSACIDRYFNLLLIENLNFNGAKIRTIATY